MPNIQYSIFHILRTFLIICFLLIPTTTFGATKELAVPFSSQAPDGVWIEPWKTACEETSTMLIEMFYFGYSKEKVDVKTAKRKILHLVSLENRHLGLNKDNTASQIVEIINKFLPWEAYVVDNPSLDQIKKEIDEGHPVMVPVHGRELVNEHFRTEQSYYHVFVIKGYDDETKEFITQEPATRFGLDYRYKYDTIMTAMHDYLPNDNTRNGKKVAVFTRKEIITSGDTDGDKDGLTKSEELKHKTILWLTDSDGDGYTDREEVVSGYSPILNETAFKNGILIKSKTDPNIYMIENGTKRKVRAMSVMKNHGWTMKDVKDVSQKFIDFKLKEGKQLSK